MIVITDINVIVQILVIRGIISHAIRVSLIGIHILIPHHLLQLVVSTPPQYRVSLPAPHILPPSIPIPPELIQIIEASHLEGVRLV